MKNTQTYWTIQVNVKLNDRLDTRMLSAKYDQYSEAVVAANTLHQFNPAIESANIQKVTITTEPTLGNYVWEDGKPIYLGHL